MLAAAARNRGPAPAVPTWVTTCRLPGKGPLYRFRTRRRYCDLRFGWLRWLRQDRGSWLFVCLPGRSLPPRDRRLGGQQIVRQCFDSFADFQQADADGVEDQPVGQVAALQVGADRVDRGLDIGQPLVLPVAHRAIGSGSTRLRTPGLRLAAGIRVDPGAEDAFEVSLEAAQPEQAQPGREVGEQVHVTVGAVFAAGHAAEYAQVAYPMRCCGDDQVLPVAADPAAHRPRQPPQAARRPPQAQRQFDDQATGRAASLRVRADGMNRSLDVKLS